MADPSAHTNTSTSPTSLAMRLVEQIQEIPANNRNLDATFTDVHVILNRAQDLKGHLQIRVSRALYDTIFSDENFPRSIDPNTYEAVLQHIIRIARTLPDSDLKNPGQQVPTQDTSPVVFLSKAIDGIFIKFPPVKQSDIDVLEHKAETQVEAIRELTAGMSTLGAEDIMQLLPSIMKGRANIAINNVPWMEQDIRFTRLALAIAEEAHNLSDEACKTVLTNLYRSFGNSADLTPLGHSVKNLVRTTLRKSQEHVPTSTHEIHEGDERFSFDKAQPQQSRNGQDVTSVALELQARAATLTEHLAGPVPEIGHDYPALNIIESIAHDGYQLQGLLQERILSALLQATYDPSLKDIHQHPLAAEAVLHYSIDIADRTTNPRDTLLAAIERSFTQFPPVSTNLLEEMKYLEMPIDSEEIYLQDMRFARLILSAIEKSHEYDDALCGELLSDIDRRLSTMNDVTPMIESVKGVVTTTHQRVIEHISPPEGRYSSADPDTFLQHHLRRSYLGDSR